MISSGPNSAEDDAAVWDRIKDKFRQAQENVNELGSDWDSFSDDLKQSVVASVQDSIPLLNVAQRAQDLYSPSNSDSMTNEVIAESSDPSVHPELAMDAQVRVSAELPANERQFRKHRAQFTRESLARYLDLPLSQVDERDVPVIAIAGSGGGYRAMIASSGYLKAAEAKGLFDCVTYVAGISGSTWMLSLYYSLAACSFDKLLAHVKRRTDVHIAFFPAFLEMVTTEPTSKYLTHGLIEKLYRKYSEVVLPDIYGLLLASRLMVPDTPRYVDPDNLKISHQRKIVDTGVAPMPIYTSVRHEIGTAADADAGRARWFQYFEITPYEFGCEELGAWIPTWSLGRRWNAGQSVDEPVPELNLSLLMGTFGSAFCATVSHFYKEIRPLLATMPIVSKLDELVKKNQDDLSELHPFRGSFIPNYVKGMSGLPDTCPESLKGEEFIELMDAGMDNNLAIYPLLRQGRDVDMIIAFDCSADIHEVPWLELAAGYSRRRGILGWPTQAGWPEDESLSAAESRSKVEQTKASAKADPAPAETARRNLGPCRIWTGTKEEKTVATSGSHAGSEVDEEYQLSQPNAGITVAYCPLIPNKNVPGVEPDSSPYMSTWNFIYSPEEIDNVVRLASANFTEAEPQIRRAIRSIYERKRKLRLAERATKADTWQSVLHERP
ncbi:acyl transferase/acyl hydrolase/lysophospholipase [Dipodascopsis tothii]|uniref:acyl transferase/acyl hydrolase/lysophospholipase n=1 Tax=Dipodascopsis tothii TaxID=44089 RepID=UPI0034CE8F95